MAKNEVVVNIKGDTSQFTRELDTLKGKIKEALGANAFSLAEISPFKLLSDGIRKGLMAVVEAFNSVTREGARMGEEIKRQAEGVNLTTMEFIDLKSAADAAGASTNAFAEALEKLKSGAATLEELKNAFRGTETGLASWREIQARGEQLGNLVLAEKEAFEEAGGAAGGFFTYLYDLTHGLNVAQSKHAVAALRKEILAGRRDYFTQEEVAYKTGDELNAAYDRAVMQVLNNEIQQLRAREAAEAERARKEKEAAEKKAEEERKRANEAAAREAEARQREEEARNSRLARDYDQMRDAGITREDALATLAVKYGLEGDALEAALNAGTWANYDHVAEAIKAARGQRSVSASSPHKYLADENDGDGITEGDLNATWLTAGGGSLLRGGSGAALAMGRRMRAISIQEQLLDRLDRVAANTETTAQAAQQVADNTAE